MLKDFFNDESGNITVGLSIMFPILVIFVLLTEVKWQAHYIRLETQAILDFAALGAATTGKTQLSSNGNPICYIPYNEDNQNESGYHVAKYLIKENISMLPSVLQTDFTNMLNNNEINGMENWNLQQNGYMHLKVNFNYRNPLNILFNRYIFNIESTAQCQPYFADEY